MPSQQTPLLHGDKGTSTGTRRSCRRLDRNRFAAFLMCSILAIWIWSTWTGCILEDAIPFAADLGWGPLSSSCSPALSSVVMRTWVAFDFLISLFLMTFRSKKIDAATLPLLPSYPLAVKNPWLSVWVPGKSLSDAPTARPRFWTGDELTWPVMARIDGISYFLFGSPEGLEDDVLFASTRGVSYSSTHTYIEVSASETVFVLDYFTPVYPKTEDYALQSLPYSYLTVNATTHGNSSIQIMSAIDQTWTAQHGACDLTYTQTDKVAYFEFFNPNEIPYSENGSNDFNGLKGTNMATWGKIIWASTIDSASTTYQCSSAASAYSSFAQGGNARNSSHSCSGSDLAIITKDLNGASVTFAIGQERDPIINYLGADQMSYHRAKWPEVQDALEFFLQNYEEALATSLALDELIHSKTKSVSSQFGSKYADICEASVRQSFASLELTVPANDSSARPWAFLKEISSNGNMNTVDLIFQSWPIFINFNPEWIILQLIPILEYLKSGRWPKEYVIHDIGNRYPRALGHDDGRDEDMPLFETSAMLILVYAYQKLSGDKSYTERYRSLWPGWANYLANNGLYPASQIISVDAIPASANQTALAMQSAIGLKAAAHLTGNYTYADIADAWATKIYDDGVGLDGSTKENSTHFTYNYGSNEPWNVIFTSFSDVLLNLTTFPQEAWDMQSKWYMSQMHKAGLAFAGPPSDRNINWGLTDWNIMTASAMSQELQNAIVDTTHRFLTNGKHNVPFGTKYIVHGPRAGTWIGNLARGTVGTHFAISAMQQGVWAY